MRKLGALDGAMENLGHFAHGEIGNPLKQWENCEELNDLMRNTELWAPDDAMGTEILGKLETLAMMKLGLWWPDDIMENPGSMPLCVITYTATYVW